VLNVDVKLKSCLDGLARDYDSRFLDTDPLGLVHRYRSDEDRETAGLVVSTLAYGSALQIRRSASSVLDAAGPSPARFVRTLTPERALEVFGAFKHRWTGGGDIAFLFWAAGEIAREHGSIGGLVRELDDGAKPTIEETMIRFSDWMRTRHADFFSRTGLPRGAPFPIPSPARGSACKRLAMYFRWMVRGPDGIDFGIWNFIPSRRLVVPVDAHVARMGECLGLTARRTPDWRMVLEITDSLRRLDPEDPVRYDFALVRPGILRECTSRSRGDCRSCLLRAVCREAS